MGRLSEQERTRKILQILCNIPEDNKLTPALHQAVNVPVKTKHKVKQMFAHSEFHSSAVTAAVFSHLTAFNKMLQRHVRLNTVLFSPRFKFALIWFYSVEAVKV